MAIEFVVFLPINTYMFSQGIKLHQKDHLVSKCNDRNVTRGRINLSEVQEEKKPSKTKKEQVSIEYKQQVVEALRKEGSTHVVALQTRQDAASIAAIAKIMQTRDPKEALRLIEDWRSAQ